MTWDCANLNRPTGMQAPRPDISIGFPVLRQDREATLGLERNALVSNFNVANLRKLSQNGLVSSPAESDQHMRQPSRGSEGSRICFPFATIDHDASREISYGQDSASCRAANAASKSLNLLEKLYRFADMQDPNFHIPAVVSLTSYGPTVRIWTAFSLPCRDGRSAHVSAILTSIHWNIANRFEDHDVHQAD